MKRTDPCLGSDRRSLNNPRNKLESTDSRALEDGEESKQSKADTLAVHHQEPLEGNDTGEIYLLCGNRRRAAAQQVFLCFARRGLREFVNERNPTWRFEVSKVVSRELDDFGFRDGPAGTEHGRSLS